MRRLVLAVCPLLFLAACSPAPEAPAPASTTPATTAAAPARDANAATPTPAILAKYSWRLRSARNADGELIPEWSATRGQPLRLDFTPVDVAVSNTCNNLHGTYRIADGKISFGPMGSTMKACTEPALAALDKVVGESLQGSLPIAFVAAKEPRLTLTDAAGNRLAFVGAPTAATQYGGSGESVFLEVAPDDATCHIPFMPDMACPNVREVYFDAKGVATGTPGAWHPMSQAIKGYRHEPGVRNVLRVKRYHIANAPANASSTAYVLDLVVQTELPKAK